MILSKRLNRTINTGDKLTRDFNIVNVKTIYKFSLRLFKINIDFWFSKAIKSKIYPKVDLLFLDLFKRIGHDIIGKGIFFLQSLLVFLKKKKLPDFKKSGWL